ncbi:hypothetical protein [Salinispira pacifica]
MAVMNQRLRSLRAYLLPSAGLVLFLSGSLLFLFPFAGPQLAGGSPESSFRGYFTLLVGEEVGAGLVTDALERAGITGVVSSNTATVSFNDITGPTTVTVADIDRRLDPRDPRLDPYMKRVPAYFQTRVDGRGMQIYYLPAHNAGILRINSLVHRALDGFHIDWYLLEWNGLRRALFIVSFLVFVALLIYRTRRNRLIVALGSIPWAAGILTGGYGGFAASCVLVFAWAFLAEEGIPLLERLFEARASGRRFRRHGDDSEMPRGLAALAGEIAAAGVSRELKGRAGFYLVALAVAALLRYDASLGVASLLSLFPGLFATTALGITAGWAVRRRAERREHRIFMPSRILRPTILRALRGAYVGAVPLLLVLVMLPPIVLLAVPSGSQVSVPRPVTSGIRGGINWGSLEQLWSQRDPHALPDLADYLAHRAYQDSFLYQSTDRTGGGAAYRFPTPGETVTIPTYTFDGTRVTEHPEVMFTFGEGWFRKQLDRNDGLVAMLRTQGGPVEVQVEPAARLYGDATILLRHAGIVLLLFLPFLVSLVRLTVRIRYGLRDTLVRRKKIEA